MIVRTVMTPSPVTVAPEALLDEALLLMDEKDVRHLPVVSEGEVLGVLSDRDLLTATGWMPRRVAAARGGSLLDEPPKRVAEAMHAPAVTVSPDDTVLMAAIELFGRGIGCLPVVRRGVLVGILTETDLVKAFLEAVSRGGLAGEVDPSVETRMTRDVTCVPGGTTLGEAEEILRSLDVRHLPVLRDEALTGMLSDRDLRRARGRGRGPETVVEDVMSVRLWTVDLGSPLTDVAAGMLDHKVSAIPVLEGTRLAGLLTVTDLLEHCLGVLREPDAEREARE